MDPHIYPGKGLSLSQLTFALNEELKRVAYSSSFILDDVSQLERDISISLANIREWKNSFVQINRIPLDVLSLIPHHLYNYYNTDVLRATHVCRHWRRTFLRHAVLWSQLFLSKGEAYVNAFLERAKGATLYVIMGSRVSADTMALLSPHTQQIRCIDLPHCPWTVIQRFSDITSGPLPLLRSLRITVDDYSEPDQPGPSLPLFSGAVNVEEFELISQKSPFLYHFVIPNLTMFKLSTRPASAGLRASEILDFLEASPGLRTVDMNLEAIVLLEGVARTRVVVLPNVQTFSLDMDGGRRAYEFVTHISCPSASNTSLTHKKWVNNVHTDDDLQDLFPTTALWNAIVDRFTRSPVETVTLQIIIYRGSPTILCTLIFQSSDTTVLKLNIQVFEDDDDDMPNLFHMSLEDLVQGVFSRAPAVIQSHPQLHGTKCLRILDRTSLSVTNLSDTNWVESVADEARMLINSMAFLEELTLHGCDLRLCLNRHITHTPEFGCLPLTLKELKISQPFFEEEEEEGEEEECMAVIVENARFQHTRGAPLQRVTVYSERPLAALVGMLEQWVGVVDYRTEHYID